jgi:hypothetical protein
MGHTLDREIATTPVVKQKRQTTFVCRNLIGLRAERNGRYSKSALVMGLVTKP